MITWQECKTDNTADGTPIVELMCGMKCDKCGKEYGNEEHSFALFPDETALKDESFGGGKFVKDGDKQYCAECYAAIEAERKAQAEPKDAELRLTLTVNEKPVFNMEITAQLGKGLTVGDFINAAKEMLKYMEKDKSALAQKCRYDGDGLGDLPTVCHKHKFTVDSEGKIEFNDDGKTDKSDEATEAVGQVEQTEA